jgi:hypothetical protein
MPRAYIINLPCELLKDSRRFRQLSETIDIEAKNRYLRAACLVSYTAIEAAVNIKLHESLTSHRPLPEKLEEALKQVRRKPINKDEDKTWKRFERFNETRNKLVHFRTAYYGIYRKLEGSINYYLYTTEIILRELYGDDVVDYWLG